APCDGGGGRSSRARELDPGGGGDKASEGGGREGARLRQPPETCRGSRPLAEGQKRDRGGKGQDAGADASRPGQPRELGEQAVAYHVETAMSVEAYIHGLE